MDGFRFRHTQAFTLPELLIAVAIVSLLAAGAALLFPRYLERPKSAEADIALAEVKRLENDFFARTGTYSSDLREIGYQSGPSLKYHTVFVQVEKGPRGWSYMVLLMPNDQSPSGGRYVSQGPDGPPQALPVRVQEVPAPPAARGADGDRCKAEKLKAKKAFTNRAAVLRPAGADGW